MPGGNLKVGTLSVDLTANTATFELNLDKAAAKGKKDLEKLNKIDLHEARGTIALLGEDIGVRLPRHLQTFIAGLPGVAPLLSSAFAVTAVVTLANFISEAIKKSDEHKEKLIAEKAAASEASDAIRKHADSLQIQTLRLKDQIATLTGKIPHNAIQIAALEAKHAVDELVTSLSKAVDKQKILFQDQVQGTLSKFFQGEGAVSETARGVIERIETLKEAEAEYDHARELGDNEATAKALHNLQERQAGVKQFVRQAMEDMEELSHQADRQIEIVNSVGEGTGVFAPESMEKSRKAAEEMKFSLESLYSTFIQSDRAATSVATNNALERTVEVLKEKKALEDAALARIAANLHAASVLPTAKSIAKAAEEEGRATEETVHAREALLGIATRDASRGDAEQQRANRIVDLIRQQEDSHTTLAKKIKDERTAIDAVTASLEAQASKLAVLNAQTQGGIAGSPQQIEDFHKAVDEYQKMKEHQLQLEIQYDNLIAQTAAGQWRKMAQDFADVQKNMSDASRQMLSQFNSSLTSFVVTGKGNWRQLATSAVEDIVRIGIQWVESHTLMAAINSLFGTQQISDQAAQTAAAVAANVVMAQSAAGLTGANAMASAALIDPFIAPEIAALDFSIAEAFVADAAASRGAILPNRDMLVHTHPEEMILPRNISNFIVNAAGAAGGRGGAGGGHTININMSHSISAIDAQGFGDLIDTHADMVARKVKGAIADILH